MEIELINFDHNCKVVGEYSIGKYKFLVKENHIENLKSISKNANIRFETEILDNKVINKCIENSPVEGEFGTTATLILDDESTNSPSVFYSEFGDKNLSDDIILILSFLTGRQIYTEKFQGEMNKKYFDKVVSHDYFSSGRSSYLNIQDFLNKIKEDGLEHQFYNFTFGKSINDLPSLIAYSSFTFDAIVTKWAKKNKFSSYNLKDKKLIEKIKKYLIEKIEKSILLKLKNETLIFLLKNNINENISNDIVARINISNQPSALYKIQNFLDNIKLFDNNFDNKYLKTLNKVRNIMLHNGQIYRDNGISFDQALNINGAVPFVLFSIMEFYFCKFYLNISDGHYLQNAYDVREFLEKGIFRGHKVFEENFDEYLQRVSRNWDELG